MILEKMLQSEEYEVYQSETLLNPQYHMINDTHIDVDIMLEANEEGNFGVAHSDFIDCWREYVSDCIEDEEIAEAIEAEIDAAEQWHVDNNSLYTII